MSDSPGSQRSVFRSLSRRLSIRRHVSENSVGSPKSTKSAGSRGPASPSASGAPASGADTEHAVVPSTPSNARNTPSTNSTPSHLSSSVNSTPSRVTKVRRSIGPYDIKSDIGSHAPRASVSSSIRTTPSPDTSGILKGPITLTNTKSPRNSLTPSVLATPDNTATSHVANVTGASGASAANSTITSKKETHEHENEHDNEHNQEQKNEHDNDHRLSTSSATSLGCVPLANKPSLEDFSSDSDSDSSTSSSSEEGVGSTVEVEKHTHAHSALLIEAINDTPSFHANAEFLHVQVTQLEQWLEELQKRTTNVYTHLESIKSQVNSVIGHFMPSVTHKSVLAQDYTTLLFGRYAEAESMFWTDVFASVKRNSVAISEMMHALRRGVFARYHTNRLLYIEAYAKLQDARKELFLLPPAALPVAVRDANVNAHRCYRKMVRISTKLVLSIAELESECSLQLLETLSEQYIGDDSGFLQYDQTKLALCTELYRLKTFAKNLRMSLPQLNTEMHRLRLEALRASKGNATLLYHTPEQALESVKNETEAAKMATSAPAATVELKRAKTLAEVSPSVYGWVNVKNGRTWKLYWAFIHNGLFGLLGLTENGTAVTESNRLVVANAKFEKVADKEKDNVFHLSAEYEITFQTMNKMEAAKWEQAITTAQRLGATKHFSQRELCAWSADYQIPVLGDELAPEAATVKAWIEVIRKDTANINWLQYNSTLTSDGAAGFSSNVPSVKPMPTSALREAVIANAMLKPHGVPNAVTANFWGSVPHFKEAPDPVEFDKHMPDYPPNYPRGLIVQDMGMRAFAAQLDARDRPAPDDFVVMFFRATTFMFGCEVPARVFVTARKMLFYSCWNGLVALQSVPIERVLDIDSSHGVAFSELRVTFHSSAGNERRIVHFNLYIDSSALVQRRLSLVLQNSRSRQPVSCEELIEPLGIINLEYAEALKAKEIDMENDMSLRPPLKFDMAPKTFGEWLLNRSVGQRTSFGEDDAYEFGKGMQLKLAQDTFPCSAYTLFTIVFGPKSPVFRSTKDEHSFLHLEKHVEPWVRSGHSLERRIAQLFQLTAGSKRDKRYNYQHLEHTEHDELFVVTERRCAWEMPSGEQFHIVLKYVVYATGKGSHLQIWGRVVWHTKNVSSNTRETVQHFVKVIAQTLAVGVREAASGIHNRSEAIAKYGEVKATRSVSAGAAKVQRRHEAADQEQVAKVSSRYIINVLVHTPFMHTCENVIYGLRILFSYFLAFRNPAMFVLFVMLVVSLAFNLRLYRRSDTAYWDAALKHQEVNDYIKEMKLLPPTAPVFRRAIYSKEISDMLNNSLATFPGDDAVVHAHGCARKFQEVANMSLYASDFGTQVYYAEPHVREATERIAKLRLEYAMKRNDMLTFLRMLDVRERSDLRLEYERWMISESEMCARARPELHSLNESVYESVSLYCLSCLDEVQLLL